MSLTGKIILVTRRLEQSDEMVAEIERRGGRAVVIPMIAITDPVSWMECDNALDSIGQYNGIVFASANAVRKFFQRLADRHLKITDLATLDVVAVGERTKDEIERHGLQVIFVPEQFSSASLARYFTRQTVSGKRFLVPKGNLGRPEIAETLKELGGSVDVIEVYTNSNPPGAGIILRESFRRVKFDVVTFASPSAVRNFAREISPATLRTNANRTNIAVIGPSTKQAAMEVGFDVDIEAEQSTSEGLIEAIDRYYSRTHQQVP